MKPHYTSLALLLALAAWASPSATAECSLQLQAQGRNGEAFVLRNANIEATVLFSSGRVDSLVNRHNGLEYLDPIVESMDSHSPLLPGILRSNTGGFADWFWREQPPSPSRFETRVLEDSAQRVAVEFSGMLHRWQVRKVVSLVAGSPVLQQDIWITNAGAGERTLAYWAHAMVASPLFIENETGGLFFAGGKGGTQPKGRSTVSFDSAGLHRIQTKTSSRYYDITSGWAAAVQPEGQRALLMFTQPEAIEPDGFLYRWQGGDRTSVELVMGNRILAGGKGLHYTVWLAPLDDVSASLSIVEKTLNAKE